MRLNGDVAYYNVNRHINYTNVCVIDCQLCQGAYARKPGEEGGYTMGPEQVFELAASKYNDSVTEFHIVGGLNPSCRLNTISDCYKAFETAFQTFISRRSRWWSLISLRRSRASLWSGSSNSWRRPVWAVALEVAQRSLPRERVR